MIDYALDRCDKYVRDCNWIGYDPYDLRAHFLFTLLDKIKIISSFVKGLSLLFPRAMRRLLGIQPVPHPKAMALFAEAYLTLFDITRDDEYRVLAEERLKWLLSHASPRYALPAWGLPFHYKGRDFIPAGTPSVVITSIAIDAFLHAYRSLENREYIDTAIASCQFLVTQVPRYEPDKERLCFSKVAGVQWNVHNANLMVAAVLSKVSRTIGSDEWDHLIRRAVNYTLAEQRPDGAWYYWGSPSPLLFWVDHYHTGFILRALDDIISTTGWTDLEEALNRGYKFYIQNLFDNNYIPRMTDRRRYPVDIHSCAEAILCLSQLSYRYKDALERAMSVAKWTLKHMWDPDGYFYYRRYRWFTIKMPYMRWSQAWMMAALSHLQAALKNPGGSRHD